MSLTSLYPAQGLQSFVDETTNLLVASSSMSSGQLGGSGIFRSTVSGRASITDISQNLKASLGIDRIPIQQIYLLQSEFGPNGEPVSAVVNDDRGLIRLVGQWSTVTLANNNGLAVGTAGNITDYLEVTFYGTGLNILANDRTAQAFVASVDGAAEGANFMPSPLNVLSARGYACNQPINVVAGLTLGIHTVKIRNNNASVSGYVYGVEVLNESAGIVANSGSAYVNGRRNYTASQVIGSYNSGFTNVYGTANARGGHVLVYQDVDGVVKRDIQYVNAAQANLTSADHTNEEILRTYNWREFGVNRTDDFSTLTSSSNRSFVLDDGVTVLTGNSVVQTTTANQDLVYITTAGTAYIAITFVGTGLDITAATNNATTGNSPNEAIIIDGVTVTSTFQFALLPTTQRFKIVSGLPYGTHTVRIAVQSGGSGVVGDLAIRNFIVYQPKKPALPVGAMEVADYNLVATYVASTTLNQYGGDPSVGTIVKSPSREVVYTGTWGGGLQIITGSSTGWADRSNTVSDFVEYTFFGTGVEILGNWGSAAVTATVQIDGANYTGAATVTGSGSTWTPGTSTWSINSATANGSALQITGLSLGMHKVRVTNQSTNGFVIVGFGIITPVHSARTNLYGDFQSTLQVGSQGVSDNRQNQPLKLQPAQKAWVQAIGVTSSPTTSSTTYVLMPDMSCVVKTSASRLRISFVCPSVNSSGVTSVGIFVDGQQVGPDFQQGSSGVDVAIPGVYEVLVSAGVHKVDLYWKSASGTITALNTSRVLLVEEL